MSSLRRRLLRNRALAAWLLAAALLLKLLVPTGYMIDASGPAITIELCSGYAPTKMTMTMAMPGMAHRGETPDHQGKEMPCAFAGLAAAPLAAADPLLLAAAILFVVATVFRAADRRRPPIRSAFLRPPLRGPPALG